MAVTQMSVTGQWIRPVAPFNTPCVGSVTFVPNATARFVNTGIIVPLVPIVVTLDAGGNLNVLGGGTGSVLLARCPNGYTVTEDIDALVGTSTRRTYVIPDGATADLTFF